MALPKSLGKKLDKECCPNLLILFIKNRYTINKVYPEIIVLK